MSQIRISSELFLTPDFPSRHPNQVEIWTLTDDNDPSRPGVTIHVSEMKALRKVLKNILKEYDNE